MRRSMNDERGMAEALKGIGERLDAIEASTGSGSAWGKGPADAHGNLVWH